MKQVDLTDPLVDLTDPEVMEGLRVVDAATGEVVCTLADVVQPYLDQIAGLQRDIRGWRARYHELKRNKSVEAKNHPLYADVETVFREWQRACNHPRSPLTADRFWLAVPYFENPKYGMKMAMRAVKGAAYDPYITRRKNGTLKRHDGWELIFRDAGKFEEFVNRAPRKDT